MKWIRFEDDEVSFRKSWKVRFLNLTMAPIHGTYLKQPAWGDEHPFSDLSKEEAKRQLFACGAIWVGEVWPKEWSPDEQPTTDLTGGTAK